MYSCDCALQDREIKELASSETYERYLKKSVSVAEKNVEKSFHCKSADCPGWCVYDDNVNVFNCPVCAHQNCINCQAMHEGSNCRQYQEELEFSAAIDEEAKKTKQFLEVPVTTTVLRPIYLLKHTITAPSLLFCFRICFKTKKHCDVRSVK